MHNASLTDLGRGHRNRTAALQVLSTALLCLLAAVLSSCGNFWDDPNLTSVTVSPSSPSVAVNKTVQLTAVGEYDDGTSKNLRSVTWSSSDPDIATVSASGLLKGVSSGTVTVTAAQSGKSGTTSAMVTIQNVESITVGPSTASILSGQTQAFTATAVLNDGTSIDVTDAVTWKSSDTTVAKIASTGVAIGEVVDSTKTATITATSGTIVSNNVVLTVSP